MTLSGNQDRTDQTYATPCTSPAAALTGLASGKDVTVYILLSTYNGSPWLAEQLDSLRAQSHRNWVLLWRDDGSHDASGPILRRFGREVAQPVIEVADPHGHLGASASFVALVRAVLPRLGTGDLIAFADQDDVWRPDKLARGVAAFACGDGGRPALYCTRQLIVDGRLRPIRESARLMGPVGFPAALAQNIATGCTIVLNRGAADLIAASAPAEGTLHDWWCYLIVSAAGGTVLVDPDPTVLYRQHGQNLVGAPRSFWSRAVTATHRGPVFMTTLRGHVASLLGQSRLLDAAAIETLTRINRALQGGVLQRLAVLRSPDLRRQTWLETMVFRVWFLLG